MSLRNNLAAEAGLHCETLRADFAVVRDKSLLPVLQSGDRSLLLCRHISGDTLRPEAEVDLVDLGRPVGVLRPTSFTWDLLHGPVAREVCPKLGCQQRQEVRVLEDSVDAGVLPRVGKPDSRVLPHAESPLLHCVGGASEDFRATVHALLSGVPLEVGLAAGPHEAGLLALLEVCLDAGARLSNANPPLRERVHDGLQQGIHAPVLEDLLLGGQDPLLVCLLHLHYVRGLEDYAGRHFLLITRGRRKTEGGWDTVIYPNYYCLDLPYSIFFTSRKKSIDKSIKKTLFFVFFPVDLVSRDRSMRRWRRMRLSLLSKQSIGTHTGISLFLVLNRVDGPADEHREEVLPADRVNPIQLPLSELVADGYESLPIDRTVEGDGDVGSVSSSRLLVLLKEIEVDEACRADVLVARLHRGSVKSPVEPCDPCHDLLVLVGIVVRIEACEQDLKMLCYHVFPFPVNEAAEDRGRRRRENCGGVGHFLLRGVESVVLVGY